jgi:hypothetical protein
MSHPTKIEATSSCSQEPMLTHAYWRALSYRLSASAASAFSGLSRLVMSKPLGRSSAEYLRLVADKPADACPRAACLPDDLHHALAHVVEQFVGGEASRGVLRVIGWLQSVIIHSQGPDSALRKAIGRDHKGKISPVGYTAGCLCALFIGGGSGAARPGIWLAVGFFVAVAGLWVIPDRRIETVITVRPRDDQDEEPAEQS